jgi:type IV secretion system protein VirB5
MTARLALRLAACLPLLLAAPARGQLAVVDVASVAQLVHQAETLAQQLATAQGQLQQQQAQYRSLTGSRGMQTLLAGSARNYLPTQWPQLASIMNGQTGGFGLLAQSYQANLQNDALLSESQLRGLPVPGQSQLLLERQPVALLQALTQSELNTTSARFSSLQQLIDAMATATDPKAVLDLQARIAAEQSMLQNEQSKLQVLFQATVGQQWYVQQRDRERAAAGQGQFQSRFEPAPR